MDHRPTNPARFKGVLVATLVAILVASLLPTAALATHNATNTNPCQGATTADDFADYDNARDTHKPSIDCALYRGVTAGSGTNAAGEPIYRPRQRVDRAQMAQFIVNTIVSAGYDDALPSGQGQDEFNDISDSFARVAINRLAKAGIVSGTGRNRYSPEGFVTRQQMATFIVQAARHIVGEQHPVRRDNVDRFQDVPNSNVHKGNIEAGADAGLFQGTSATTFSPGVRVLRDQMATFLVNQLDYSFNPDQAPPPFIAEVNIAEREVEAGDTLTGDITGENIKSAQASGCGLNNASLTDGDNQAEGIQFEVTIPANQRAGDCELTVSVTFTNNSVRQFTETLTVTAENAATVTLEKTTVNQGDAVTGEITGNNIKSATLSGCGLTNKALTDRDTKKADLQFSEVIPANQTPGKCTLTFKVTFDDNSTEDVQKEITVTEGTGVTTQPELVSAEILTTTSTGTTVGYRFDESVTGDAPTANRFVITAFDATREIASSAQIQSGNTDTVVARFTNVTTAAEAADYTVATVMPNAVTDDQTPSQQNPEGNAAIGAAREDTIRQPGATAAPDLASVGPFRSAEGSNTAVDFTFDEAAYTFNPSGFRVVLLDGTVVNCNGPAVGSTTPGGGSQAGGDGTTRITAVCPNPSSGGSTTVISATNTARGYVEAETVSDAEQDVTPVIDEPDGNANSLQAEDVAASGNTSTPDLVSAAFTPGAGGAEDEVVYTFDEVVLATNIDSTRFRVYDTTATEHTANSAARGSDTKTVVAKFPNGTLADAVGASVYPAAVTQGPGNNPPNRADEVGVTNSTTRTITPGRTAGPDLVSVSVKPGNGTATYTFDEDVNATPTGAQSAQPANFNLWLSDGTKLECFGFPGTSSFTIEGKTVTCGQYRQGNNAPASAAQVGSAVLGTVEFAAVDDAESGETKNPEGAAPTTGGTGTPAQ